MSPTSPCRRPRGQWVEAPLVDLRQRGSPRRGRDLVIRRLARLEGDRVAARDRQDGLALRVPILGARIGRTCSTVSSRTARSARSGSRRGRGRSRAASLPRAPSTAVARLDPLLGERRQRLVHRLDRQRDVAVRRSQLVCVDAEVVRQLELRLRLPGRRGSSSSPCRGSAALAASRGRAPRRTRSSARGR